MTIIPNLTANFRRNSMVNYAFPELHPKVNFDLFLYCVQIIYWFTPRPTSSLPQKTCSSTLGVVWTLWADATVYPSPFCLPPQPSQIPLWSPSRERGVDLGKEGEGRRWGKEERHLKGCLLMMPLRRLKQLKILLPWTVLQCPQLTALTGNNQLLENTLFLREKDQPARRGGHQEDPASKVYYNEFTRPT